MIMSIINILTGSVFKRLTDIYEKKLQADNDSQKMAAEFAVKQMEADLEIRQNAKEIRLATAGFWEMRVITFLIALPFVVHLWAVALDTVFKLGWKIPAYPYPFNEWQGVILLSFFGVQIAGKAMDTLAFIFRGKK